ncbi:MAG: hypothetical protein KC635_15975 [Myxococcales bacterium]|nr:hypothetical protein [Myxococcales bacterium]MCB9736644.1 hypothetical protein [Deltaproteobacteria bacterium]
MRSLLGATLTIAALGMTPGCAAKATKEDCAKACENLTTLYLGSVDREAERDEVLKAMGKTGSAMAREMAALQLDFLKEECERECNEKATVKQTDCLSQAQSSEDLSKCN